MITKLRDLRLLAIVLLYIIGFLPFISVSAERADGAYEGTASMIDLVGNRFVMTGKIYYILPIVIVLIILFLENKISPKLVYLVGGVFGLGLTFFTLLFTGRRIAMGNKYGPSIGFFLVLAVWVFVLAWTLIKDFAISKDSIKQNGIKGALSGIANQTLGEADTALSNMKGIDIGSVASGMSGFVTNMASARRITCPACGKAINEGDAICTYCGAKIERGENNSSATAEKKPMTVAEYIMNLKEYKCDNCGETVTTDAKFCPNCGSAIAIKVKPASCQKCGRDLASDFDYCPGCGTFVEKVQLQTKCSNCGADLLYGKNFCNKCGTKVI